MSGERSWPDVERIFHDALAKPSHEREAFVLDACGGDARLLSEVQSLLLSHEDARRALPTGGALQAIARAEPPFVGQWIGTYQVTTLIGAGGMGEVYRAHDRVLRRDVAIKVLPPAFASDPDRLSRFQREARVLAALNHPHIAAIYGLEDSASTRALVLELVEGSTLADLIEAGPDDRRGLPLPQALRFARQISEALEAAHGKGIIHRDLKPANIKVTPANEVKVLDFGLAKAWTGPDQHLSQHVTMTATVKREGVLMGTAAYMSPEQARGQPVDQRTDVWAFGAVLYEMLAGRAAFHGDTISDTLAHILGRDPDWRALPATTPIRIRELIKRCLQKDADERLRDIAEARREIDACLASQFNTLRALANSLRFGLSRPAVRWTVAVGTSLAAAGLVYSYRERAAALPVLANPVQFSSAIGVEDYPSWSPDGRTLAYESDEAGNWDIWLAQIGGEHVDRTADHPGQDRYPSWSPDGRQIAFWSDREGGGYFLMPSLGGPARRIMATSPSDPTFFSPAAWSADGTHIAAVNYSASGAHNPVVEIISTITYETQRLPLPGSQSARVDLSWSRDGAFLAYVDFAQPTSEVTRLVVLNVSAGTNAAVTGGRTNDRSPQWSADGRYLYYVSNRSGAADVWRQRMQRDGIAAGEPERVTTGIDIRHLAFSPDGKKLAYSKGRWVSNIWQVPVLADRTATWADARQLTFDQAFVEFMDISRNGGRLVFSSDRMGNQDLWWRDVAGREPSRLTADPTPDWNPRWSPDGQRIAFYGYRTGERQIWVMPAEGGPARQLTFHRSRTTTAPKVTGAPDVDFNGAPDWSPDGRTIAFTSLWSGAQAIWIVPSDGGEPKQLTNETASLPAWSPDGLWIAGTSNREGISQIWRMPVSGGPAERLTDRSGRWPRWSPDGGQIYFIGAQEREGNLWSVVVNTHRERKLTDFAGRRGSLGSQGLAADGKFLYFAWRDDLGDVWAMDVR
jgi:Tol biopolymer transport system component/serine/threonine protein kinase